MQTPASMVMGIVFAPLGLVLVFMAAITPQWREGQTQLVGVAGAEPRLLLRTDGLWESCLQVAHSELKQCWPVEGAYQSDPQVRLAQGLVLSSLFLCGAGIVLASVGVRCWTDLPLRSVVAAGGLLVALSGLLSLTALGVYTHNLGILGMEQTPPTDLIIGCHSSLSTRPGRSTSAGWGDVYRWWGVALLLSFKIRPRCPSCSQLKNKQDTEVYDVSC